MAFGSIGLSFEGPLPGHVFVNAVTAESCYFVQVVVSGKLRGQRAKAMKFVDGYVYTGEDIFLRKRKSRPVLVYRSMIRLVPFSTL